MADGLLLYSIFAVPRNQASPSTQTARGPPSLAAWKGMGPSGYQKPLSFTVPSQGYVIVLLVAILMSALAQGLPQNGKSCPIEKCAVEYEEARHSLDIDDRGQLDVHAECKALRTYSHCTSNTTGCLGNLKYLAARRVIDIKMKQFKCPTKGEIVHSKDTKPREPLIPNSCVYHGKRTFKLCGLFGDPHLRTFNEQFQTCKVKGAWPLINNDYLNVQVTNNPVEGNTDATATSKLTVIVKGNPECTSKDFQTYQAQYDNLPNTFEDGRVTYGPYKSLELVEVDPGKHVEIHIRYIETVVVIRQIGHYFTFSARMPEELVNRSSSGGDLQLCVRGCPHSERIDYREYLTKRKNHLSKTHRDRTGVTVFTRHEAERVCREAKVVDFYFDSCVFDLMATGDKKFTLSALYSLQDVMKLQPNSQLVNRSTLDDYDREYGSNNGVCVVCGHQKSQQFVLLLLFVTLTVTYWCDR